MADEENNSPIIADRRNSTEAALIGLTKDFSYLQRDISEIKKDVKEIKNESVSRREFEDKIKALKDEYDPKIQELKDANNTLRNQVYGVAGIVISAVVYAVINQVLK